MLLEQFVFAGVGCQFGGDGEQFPLQLAQHIVHLGLSCESPGHTHDRDSLVGDAVGLGVRAVLGDPASVEQAGLAGVAKLGVNLFPVVA